jgi:hypothetical protein
MSAAALLTQRRHLALYAPSLKCVRIRGVPNADIKFQRLLSLVRRNRNARFAKGKENEV